MSSVLDSMAVCLGAVSALRAVLCIDESLRYPTFTALLRNLPWQSHALSVIAGLATVIYAEAGGSRAVLVTSVLIANRLRRRVRFPDRGIEATGATMKRSDSQQPELFGPSGPSDEAKALAQTDEPVPWAIGSEVREATSDETSMEAFVRSLIDDDLNRTTIQVFDPGLADAVASIQSMSIDSDARQKMQMALKKLLVFGTTRPKSQPDHTWSTKLAALRLEFPGLTEVLDQVIKPHLSLIAAGARRVRMPPILLVGPPGLGKTAFARRLAELFGTGCLSIDMASATNGAALAGSSTFWANSQPSQLFSAIAFGIHGHPPYADPVIVLDEVDKVSTDRYDPLGPLFTLLEQETARRFEDQALPGLVFDASLVRWILTANEIGRIPEPILSRVLIYKIEPPTGKEMLSIGRRMLESTVRDLGIQFEPRLPEELAPLLSDQTPRTLKVRLELAVGSALSAGRDHIVAADLVTLLRSRSKSSIGFV